MERLAAVIKQMVTLAKSQDGEQALATAGFEEELARLLTIKKVEIESALDKAGQGKASEQAKLEAELAAQEKAIRESF